MLINVVQQLGWTQLVHVGLLRNRQLQGAMWQNNKDIWAMVLCRLEQIMKNKSWLWTQYQRQIYQITVVTMIFGGMAYSFKLPHLDVNTAVLLNEQLYKHKEAIRILTPLTSSGSVITLCIGYYIYFEIFHLFSACSPLLLTWLASLHAVHSHSHSKCHSSWEIRHQPGCRLLFEPRSEDSGYNLETTLSHSCYPLVATFAALCLYPHLFIPFISILISQLPLNPTSKASPPILASPITCIKSNGTH